MKKGITLNILNGQMMYEHFKKHHLFVDNALYVPFNEAMCSGEASADIFSEEFNKLRCQAHGISKEKYIKITLEPLQYLFEGRGSEIVLWFDEDMFCQINLLTLLAYLDQIDYRKKVKLNLVDQEYNLTGSFLLDAVGYKETYKQVMLYKNFPENINLPVLRKGVKLYLEYLKENNEIIEYIRQNENVDTDILIKKLIKKFPEYGLGDTQYLELINNVSK